MSTSELFKGIAVIIDDEIDDEIDDNKANIKKILNQIKKTKIPYLAYDSIPSDTTIANFHNLSFLLLDWKLINEEEIISIPTELLEENIKENIKFLKKLKEICFCPVFIFSNEHPGDIIKKLKKEGLYIEDRPNHIFVKSKTDLIGDKKLFTEIEKWINSNSSIYVLKKWENQYRQSKNKLFSDFQKLSPVWAKIMWDNFKKDGINPSFELGELISRNLHTRMKPFDFSGKILNNENSQIDTEELKKVLEGERFLQNNNLNEDDISPGDIFKDKKYYYINIRPACDCITDRGKEDSTYDDVNLYLLRGSKLSDEKTKESFKEEYGQFSEIDSQSIIFPVDNGKAIDFRFKKLCIKKWEEVKKKRIGRILPPHINRLQQKYAAYLQRQGISRTPDNAVAG
jgi:hypothetical protein